MHTRFRWLNCDKDDEPDALLKFDDMLLNEEEDELVLLASFMELKMFNFVNF